MPHTKQHQLYKLGVTLIDKPYPTTPKGIFPNFTQNNFIGYKQTD